MKAISPGILPINNKALQFPSSSEVKNIAAKKTIMISPIGKALKT